ncbi:MAG TPA: TIGR00730 family Rossman fold protein [Anaerolineales bacterium]
MKSICVYCGSSDKLHPDYLEAARLMGEAIAGRGYRLVYGAGGTGLMGAVADGALAAGGEVTGVIPGYINTPKLAHAGLTRLEVVDTIHQRKARLVELADAFIALPGGYGTFEEFFEILTWAQIGLHSKPIGLLNVRHYYDPLLGMVEHARQEGFIYDEHQGLFATAEQPQMLLEMLENHHPTPGLERWLTRED